MTPRRRPERERGSTAPMALAVVERGIVSGEKVAELYELPAVDPLITGPCRVGQSPEVA